MEIPIKLIDKSNTAYPLGANTVDMNMKKEDGTNLFASNQALTIVSAPDGQVKLVLDGTFNFDAYASSDYIAHLRVMNGATIIQEVAETFIMMIRDGIL